ncbi:MAG: multifunctional CCA addition/repair protein [Legionella sp.]|nr:multifunctional CCA addition/repair protein [Legionella sp.]
MQVYLVGGAVRDQLLKYPVKERDWVVVGTTPEALLEQGYQQVGKDFPVFLHPNTREEYALARTERKSAPGYYGFQCNFDPTVTLEEDLKRRDLTINAMAMDTSGNIIDPYGGQNDLQLKQLRHVSEAFTEDPLRVLRVARFAARYYHLGFRLAPETRLLMHKMVQFGELKYLVVERLWQEWRRSLDEKNPEMFIVSLRACGALGVVLPELDSLFGVPNPPHHHPEIDSGIHSIMCLQAAVALSTDPILRFTALIHDLGKGVTPMKQWPRHIDHDEHGMVVIEQLAERLRIPSNYKKFAILASKLHLNIHRFFELNSKTRVKILEQAKAFQQPESFEQLLMVCACDALGSGKKEYLQAAAWRSLREACEKVTAKQMIEQGYEGKAIQDALHQARIEIAKQWQNNYEEQ